MNSAGATAQVYDESKIKTLSSLEHIRLRPGMYIGRLGNGEHPDDGIYILLKEIVDNAIDEFIMGAGARIEIHTTPEGTVRVRDFGRGIPLGKVVECVSHINTGAKYNTDVFQFSVGLNGVGTKAVNALSASFRVTSFRNGAFARADFVRGVLAAEKQGRCDETDGTLVEFVPDPELFGGDYRFDAEFIRKRMWRYAWLNAGLHLEWNGELFYSEAGLMDMLAEEMGDDPLYEAVYFKNPLFEFVFTHTDRYGEIYYSFVNGTYTSEGGTHLSGFREGILKGVAEFSGKKFSGHDVREGIVGALSIRLKDPIFESQTKNKLGNTEIRQQMVTLVRDEVAAWLYRHADTAERLLAKVQQNERIRNELQSVQREARAKAKKMALRIPQLKDCKHHPAHDRPSPPGRENMIFITEGQSAAGSIVSSRDPMTQAVFSLKGKPLNVFGQDLSLLYKNEEMYSLMRALDIEESISNLRYDRIILATDADVDGLHIRNLLLTFFLQYFEALVKLGYVYIIETPLFRVRNREETIYCYSEMEKDKATRSLGLKGKKQAVEITRFKGLGEISPKEFKRFIGPDMRIRQVHAENMGGVHRLLSFYMGKNTPTRKEYIMTHLAEAV